MIAVSEEFKDILKQDLIDRKIKGKVIINYTDPFLDNSITSSANSINRISAIEQTTNGRYETSYKFFSLDGSFVLGDNYHPAPDTVETKKYNELGYWSDVVCDISGIFSTTIPQLMIKFDKRPVGKIVVVGDDKRIEYPIDYDILYYDFYFNVLRTDSFKDQSGVIQEQEVEQIEGVSAVILKIFKWSKPGTTAKIIEFSTMLAVEYDDQLISLRLNESREIDADITIPSGNVGHAEVDIEVDNTDRSFDANNINSNIHNLIKPNRRIEPYLGVEKTNGTIEYVSLGIFYSDDIEVPEENNVVSIHGWNRLTLLETSTYEYTTTKTYYSFYNLFSDIFHDAGFTDYEIKIDTVLQRSEYVIPLVWLEPMTHLEALKLLCKASMANMYVDRDGIIKIETIDFLEKTNLFSSEKYTSDDYFKKSNPTKYNSLYNKINVNTNHYELIDADEEQYSGKETIEAYSSKIIFVNYENIPCKEDTLTASITDSPAGYLIINTRYFSYGAEVTIENSNSISNEIEIIITGKHYYLKNSKVISQKDENSIKSFGKKTFTLENNHLIQTEVIAFEISTALLETYREPDKDMELDVIGNPALILGDRISVLDKYTTEDFFITKLQIDFNGSLASNICGRKVLDKFKSDMSSIYGDAAYGNDVYKSSHE